MTDLSDFLKCKKVRCLSNDYDFNEQGKAYKLHGLRVFITDETGCTAFLPIEDFEPVIESAENPLQHAELTPELEAAEPKFKVGDPVYFTRLSNKLCVIGEGQEDDYVDEVNGSKALAEMQSDLDFVYDQKTKSWVWNKIDAACPLIHATPENHALLSKLHPHIKFEQPAKELEGSDLARALIKKGWAGFNCLCGNSGDKNAITDTIVTGANNGGQFTTIDGKLFNNAIPVIGRRPLEAREVGL